MPKRLLPLLALLLLLIGVNPVDAADLLSLIHI